MPFRNDPRQKAEPTGIASLLFGITAIISLCVAAGNYIRYYETKRELTAAYDTIDHMYTVIVRADKVLDQVNTLLASMADESNTYTPPMWQQTTLSVARARAKDPAVSHTATTQPTTNPTTNPTGSE